MPRPSHVADGIVGGGDCKVRKRIFLSSSSSSSSSVLQNCRLKRAVFVRKRGGLSTPFPEWKMDSSSPSSTAGVSEFSQQPPSRNSLKERQGPVSARKLANALWELTEIPSPIWRGELRKKRCKKESRRREKVGSSIQSGSLPPHLSDPSHGPVSEVMDQSCLGVRRRKMNWMNSYRERPNNHDVRTMDCVSYGSLMELEARSRDHTSTSSSRGTRSRLKDVRKGLSASKEFLKIVNHFCRLEKHHHSYIASIFSALCTELERAYVLVDQLIDEQRWDRVDVGLLNKRLMEGNAAWKRRQQEKIQEGVQLILDELEVEKKLKRRTERQNQKLVMELAEAKAALSRTIHNLENERRSREVMEHVCNELVQGIGEDKAEVEAIKWESARVHEELEREREMLQLADTWREERVHMKLTEAKFQLEEKNAAVDQLRRELEAYLVNKRSQGDLLKEPQESSFELDGSQLVNYGKDPMVSDKVVDGLEVHHKGIEDADEADSVESDLRSIELNMDTSSKGYRWSFAKRDVIQDIESSHTKEVDDGVASKYNALTRNNFSVGKSTKWLLNTIDPSGLGGRSEFGTIVDN